MKSWRRSLSVLVLSGATVAAGVGGYDYFQNIQYARAANDVDVTREQLNKAEDLATVFREVGKVVSPSVVNITVKKTVKNVHRLDRDSLRKFFGPGGGFNLPDMPDQNDGGDDEGVPEVGTGSGVIMEAGDGVGYIVTNNHVAGGAEEMEITLADGRVIKGANAKVVGTDPKSDLAVVKITADHLIAAKWGDSDQLQKGDWVLAFGSPFGYVGSMTHGIVSALHRQAHILGDLGYENFIQVDAPINPGNSGGPLVNLHGEVVGIDTAIASRSGGFQGIGFAIPSDQAKKIYEILKEKGKITRGWLGIGIRDISETPDLAKSFNYDKTTGVLVEKTYAETPASGKLVEGDIITALDGKEVKGVQDLRSAIAMTAPGTEIKLTVFRDGKSQDVSLKIGEQPAEMSAAGPSNGANGDNNTPDAGANAMGMRLTTLSNDLAQKYNLTDVKSGALITEVDPKGPAAKAGLRPGDVITKVERQSVSTAQEASDAISKADQTRDVRLYVSSADGSRFVLIHK